MSEVYSGLRRRRKRTHPSKCPCCISDDVEPENEGSAGNEEHHEGNNKKNAGHKKSKRRKIIKKKEDEYISDSEVSDHAVLAQKEEKENVTKARLRSRNPSPTNESETNKKASNNTKKNKNKSYPKDESENDKNNVQKNNAKKGKTTVSGKKEKQKPEKNVSIQKSSEDDASDEEICLSTLKASRSKKKVSSDSEMSGKKKIKISKENTNESNKKNSDIKSKKNKAKEKDESDALENVNIKTEKARQIGNKKSSREKRKKIPSKNNVQTSKNFVDVENLSEGIANKKKGRVKNIVLSSKVSQVTQMKSMVFDHLFEELKSCTGNKKLSVQEGSDILMKICADDLLLVVRAIGPNESLKGESSFRDSSSRRGDVPRQEKKVVSDTEERVSQAAEALVSFRSKSPLSREESKTELTVKTAVINHEIAQKLSTASSIEQSFGDIQKLNPPSLTTGTLSSSQGLQALMQIQTSSVVSPQIFQTHVTSSPSHNLVQGQGYMPISLHQHFPQGPPPAAINASFTSMMPLVASHGTLPSFTQITAQLRPSSMQSGVGVQSPLFSTGVTNPAVQTSSVMRPNQPLMQPQLQQTVPVGSPVNTNKLQVLTTIKNAGAQLEASGSKGPSNQKQILPQQPLKGMEEVVGNVGNVGANVHPIVWSLKSPVVFLGSPQNLGGVPRNLMATSANQGVNVTSNKEQSGYPPVAPRPAANTDNTRINPGSPAPAPNVLSLGGRPILPRTQPRSLEDGSNKKPQAIAPQSSLAFVPQQTSLGTAGASSSTPAVLGQGAVTQVSSAVNPSRTNMVSLSLPGNNLQINTPTGSLNSNSVPENTAGDCSSPTTVTAKQAVKKLVHERTKTAELKREAISSGTFQLSTRLKTILPSPPKPYETTTTTTNSVTPNDNHDIASKNNEFNLEQAATALLSIGVPDGGDILKSNSVDSLKDDRDEDVVFTSKGMFRVGDVDVDPIYNRIGREGYTCGKCNKIFTSLSYLARHIKRVCPDMSCRKWKCSLCDKAFRHPFGLQQHVYTHTGERPHKCPICPKAFYSSNDLRRHSRIHSGERPYTCKHCDKSFATTISLKTHTYIHTGEKPHKCPQCPKTFATSSKLGRHIVTHSEQRPYSCEQCPKSFNRSGDLRRHNMAVHEGKEKSFECEVCSMSFTKSADLRRHSTSHQPRVPKIMECTHCGTQFSTPICLKMHRETYHKTQTTTATTTTSTLPDTEKPCTCEICGKTYSSAMQLAKHKPSHEPTSTAGYDASQFQHIAPKPLEQSTLPGSGTGTTGQ